ncbi:MAG: polyhydroxyalkanoic acid system family protein [Planctomycetes bacterium]|nr:polyhydroxyalkanoic acid system family protein [Planctomycetota bacterium]
MPRLSMSHPHSLGREEAMRRLKEKFDATVAENEGQLKDVEAQWTDAGLTFGFKAMGFAVSGTVGVREGAVDVAVELPLAAMMVRGMIESRLRGELETLLA